MLTEYIDAALKKAKYKLLEDDEGFVATIPGCRGVIGYAKTLEACREDLRGALETWILVKLQHHQYNLPVIGGINLNPKQKTAKVA